MTAKRRQRTNDAQERLQRAESASAEVSRQGETVNRQLSLVERLSEGWRRVHAVNHLAELFRDEGRLG
jgi:hypothetical protein